MRSCWIMLWVAACRPLIDVDADPAVVWLALVTLEGDAIESATGLVPVGSELVQPDRGRALLFGFGAEIGASAALSQPVRFASDCDGTLSPIWAAEREGDRYREVELDPLPALTADWVGPKCASDRVCVRGRCLDAIVDIDAGRYSACARWSSGRVSCWGNNGYGETGRSEREVYLQTTAGSVPGIEEAEQLSVGDESSCILRRGQVTCWGLDYQGESFGMTAPVQGFPRAISGVERARSVSMGFGHGCVVVEGGGVECWGRNEHGQCGDRTVMARGDPVAAIGVSDAVQVATGDSHSCARIADGRVLCFGSNLGGQLGPGSEPLIEAIREGSSSIDIGANHSCALFEGGAVSCWGDDARGQVGGGAVQLSRPAIAVDLGAETSCALLDDGAIECWGGSQHGQLGRLEPFPFYAGIPIMAPVPAGNIDVAAGDVFTCALDAARDVWCWGSNAYGQLGNGRDGSEHERHAAFEGDVIDIAAGDEMTCTVLSDGAVQCWGHNHVGQLGRGNRSILEAPGRVMLSGPAIDVEAGASHACALISDGGVYCWGANYDRQVGPFDEPVIDYPQYVLGSAVDLALGDHHSCAILASGEVSCWGWDYFGTVGHADPEVPGIVPFVSDAIDGDAGWDQTCVRRRNTLEVVCWGRGSILESFSADDLAVGRSHSCAISGGQVFCWGGNDHGQLGDGTFNVAHARPMPVLGVTDPEKLVIGSSHACAIVSGGEIWCWGDNLASQLNDGNWPTDRATPAPIAGFEGVLFGDGYRHNCVYVASGEVVCWGWNEWGQVRLGSSAIELAPARVQGLEPF